MKNLRPPCYPYATCAMVLVLMSATAMKAEVRQAEVDGFSIVIDQEVAVSTDKLYSALVDDVAQWWDASHSYSRKAENFSFDLKRSCFLEKLENGGFVRHMEIAFHRPGKELRLTGGLGPLQPMGVNGCMTFVFAPAGEAKSKLTFLYNVSGSKIHRLDRLAEPVDGVLQGQIERLCKYAETAP